MKKSPGQGEGEDVKPGKGASTGESEPAQGGAHKSDSVDEPETLNADDAKDAAEILDGIGQMPEVQEHAIAAAKSETPKNAAPPGVATDKHGNIFDADIHCTNPDGTPKLMGTGHLVMKNRYKAKLKAAGKLGAPRTSTFKAPDPAKPGAPTEGGPMSKGSTPDLELEAKIASTAQVTSELIFTVGQAVGGEEWQPKLDKKNGIDERSAMVNAWAAYYRARGIADLPPEVMLAVALGSYAVPRFFMPATKTRVGKFKEWFYGWMGRRRARREERENGTDEKMDAAPHETNGRAQERAA